jgi:hypothetical protein
MNLLDLPIVIAGFALFVIYLVKVAPRRNLQQLSNNQENVLSKEVKQLRFDASDRKVKKFGLTFILPSALTILKVLNFKQFLLTVWRSTAVFKGNAQASSKFVIFAMYEKGEIRKDVFNALETLSQLGFSVVLINSRKLSDQSREKISKLVFCYLERPNYGRDFGSYKDGVRWLYKNHKEDYQSASRLLFINDSVFFSRKNLADFFSSLTDTQFPVFGATMNYQIIPHIGSFCLSVDSSIFTNKKFLEFWKRYRKTDLRAPTITPG